MSSLPSNPLTSFTIFLNLPFELRCMIWEASCVSRIVEIDYDEEAGFLPRAANPKALAVCKESRNSILDKYPLVFGSIYHPARTRFNFAIDTLFIDNDMVENVPHFFSTFREKEILGLRFMALGNSFNEPRYDSEETTTTQLLKMVTKLRSLRSLLVVYDIADMADQSFSCELQHTMEFHDKIPKQLEFPAVHIDALPEVTDDKENDFKRWAVPDCRPVYGWRRCPDGHVFTDMDMEYGPSDEEEDDYGEGLMWGLGYGHRLSTMFDDEYLDLDDIDPGYNPYFAYEDPSTIDDEDLDHDEDLDYEDGEDAAEDGEDDAISIVSVD